MSKYEYTPHGVCSSKLLIDVDKENDTINEVRVIGGCNGNGQGIGALLKGMKIEDAIERMSGIKCGMKNTSCPDQISQALKAVLEQG